MNKTALFLCGLVAAQCTSDNEPRIASRIEIPQSKPIIDKSVDAEQDYTQIDYSNPKIQQKIQEGVFEQGFLSNLERMCIRLDMDAMGLLTVMDYETSGTFKTDKKNKYGATGLIQFTPQTAKELATTTKLLAEMSQREQLLYIENFFRTRKNKIDYSNPQNIALTVIWPSAIAREDDATLFSRKSDKTAYRRNSRLDLNKDGKVTVGEYLSQALQRGYLTHTK
jgi:hypothetical protein